MMSRKLHSRLLTVLVAGVLTSASAAWATTTLPTPMLITATVLKVCVAGVGTPIVLSTITSSGGLTGSGTVTVICTANTPYDVQLDSGANATSGAGPTQRLLKLTLGTATMTYGLYQDSAYGTPWGNATGTNTLHKTAGGLLETWPVYMKVDSTSAQTAPAGVYTDTVQLSVEY
jgi:spore coat protein U-like protein